MKNLKTSVIFKVGVIILIALLLLIPATMVKDIIREREHIQTEAIDEVSNKWGQSQVITGPYLSIPYDQHVTQFTPKDSSEKIITLKKWLHFLPNKLAIDGNISPEKRYRGIYEIVVYDSDITFSGDFSELDFKKFDINANDIHFDKATFNIGISALKGIEEQIQLDWEGQSLFFNSGTSTRDLVESGINCPVDLSGDFAKKRQFSLNLDLKGSQYLHFVPLGKTTDVTIQSNWNNPSFGGEFLPDTREVTAVGFTANWNILHLNRNYPQSWSDNVFSVANSAFGVNLLLPVDRYHKSMRVVKYAILFLGLTFLVFFFIEVMNKVFIHPIQYILVGIAIVVFYTLLIAFSEHIGFNISYLLSSVLTLALISAYVMAILKSRKVALLISGMLAILYGFIFTIIQLQDYALLMGSIGVFIILAVVMYISRKIDWYSIRLGEEQNVNS